MNWRAFLKPGGSRGACSISKTTPSREDAASATALSISTGVNAAKATLPSCKVLITPLRRGISGMSSAPIVLDDAIYTRHDSQPQSNLRVFMIHALADDCLKNS